MMKIELFSEPFAKTGNIAAEGFRKLLGSPARDILQTMLREAIQNSVDAAKLKGGPEVLIRVRTLDEGQKNQLATRLLTAYPPQDSVISRSLMKRGLRVLEICDFNSTGLGGPTSADVVSEADEPQDFINFIRNVGMARDTHHGGGTYGYGKTSLYAMSACSTILVDTQTFSDGRPVRRLIGCHLGGAYAADGEQGKRKRFTGRHWWGVLDGDSVEPVTGSAAADMAAALGLPVRGESQTGTSILILDPLIDEKKGDEWLWHYMREIILWNFWPRLTASTPADRKLSVVIEIEGKTRELPKPEEFPPLDLFAAALEACRTGSDGEIIRCRRPKKDLGRLVIKRGLSADRYVSSLAEDSLIPRHCSHVALMRPVELVVKYVAGTPYADSRHEWAGVFICSDDDQVESAFAMSEPPAHDDWIPENLPVPGSTFVRVALREIKNKASAYAVPAMDAARPGERGTSLAKTSMQLGRLLDSVSGRAPGKSFRVKSSVARSRTLSISTPQFKRLVLAESGQRHAVFESYIQNDGSKPSLIVVAQAYLVVDGARAGTSDLPPQYATEVVRVEFEGAGKRCLGPKIHVGTASGTIRVTVICPADAAVGVRLFFDEEGDE